MTSNALIYPQYLPSALELRVNLLINDSVSTIVPSVDQSAVMRRPQMTDIIDHLPKEAFSFHDPSFRYNSCLDQVDSLAKLKKITAPITRSMFYKSTLANVRLNDYGEPTHNPYGVTLSALLKDNGWQYLASQKVPHNLLCQLFEMKLAVRVRSLHYETFPILVHGRVASFILSQLARRISAEEGLRMVTSDSSSLKDGLFESHATARPENEEMLALMLSLSMPMEIEQISGKDFGEVRKEFKGVRENLDDVVKSFTSRFDLNCARSANNFRELFQDKVSDIDKCLADAQRTIRSNDRARILNFGVNILSSGVGAAIGSALGGIPGATIGALIAPVATTASQKLTTATMDQHNQGITRLAALKTSLQKRSATERFLSLR